MRGLTHVPGDLRRLPGASLLKMKTLSNTFKLLRLLLTAQVCSRPRAST